jgi:hypothetical protein
MALEEEISRLHNIYYDEASIESFQQTIANSWLDNFQLQVNNCKLKPNHLGFQV